MKIVAIIQARMGSTRLPGKILMPLLDIPMLVQVVERVRRSKLLNEIVLATTTDPKDDPVESLCRQRDIACYRGSEYDVLDRYYQAAIQHKATIVVRITADCPLIDPVVIDQVIEQLIDHRETCVYASNVIPIRTFPRGLDTEVFTFQSLQSAWEQASQTAQREHVTPFIWSQPDRFPQRNFCHNSDCSNHRWTVDTPEDFAFVREVYRYFGSNQFTWTEVLAGTQIHPEWELINSGISQKPIDELTGKSASQAISLRDVIEDDAWILWNWANDPVSRSVSFSPDPIPWEVHFAWFRRKLICSGSHMFIGERETGEKVGLVRFDCENERAVISVNVAPEARGKGVGARLIRIGSDRILADNPEIEAVFAYIKPDNDASVKAFAKAGYVPDGTEQLSGTEALRMIYTREGAK